MWCGCPRRPPSTGAPLLLGTDLTALSSTDMAMLTNDRIIAVDQDGVAARRIINATGQQVFSKREANGDYIVALFNNGTSGNQTITVTWSQVGFTGSGDVTDLWSGNSGGRVANAYTATLRPGEPRLIRVRPVTGGGSSTVEAEAAGNTIAGAARIASCAACSGGNKVGYIGNGAANYLTVNGVNSPAAGSRTLTISYLLNGSRTFFISVNGGPDISVPLTGTSWSTPATKTITVTVNAGANGFTFHNDTAYAPDLDKISLS